MRMRSVWGAAALTALSFGALAACDDRLAMQPARDHTEVAEAPAAAARADRNAPARNEARAEAPRPVRLIQGRPMWSDSRRYTAEQNAQYQFEHHATELGARNLDEFLARAHRFANSPPDGALSLTRANGDRLLFDPKTQLFGVVRSDGAPRTVFKPETGQAYWDDQVAQEGQRAQVRAAADRG
jgi:pyocin large subunit-like protein